MTLRSGALGRLVLAAVGVVLGVLVAGDALLHAALPGMRHMLPVIAPDFEVRQLALRREQGEHRVAVEVNLARTVVVGGRAIVPDPRGSANASTPAGHGLLAPGVAVLAIVAWPWARWRELLARLVVCLPLMAGWLVLDAPLMLAASLWQLVLDAAAPNEMSLLAAMPRVLVGGGRILAGVVLAAASVALVSRWVVLGSGQLR